MADLGASKMRQTLSKFIVISAVALLLSSCGYRLCNPCVAWPDNVKRVYLSTNDPGTPVYQALQRRLENQSMQLATTETTADVVIVLLSESQDKRLLAVASGNQPAEYELIYKVRYRVDQENKQPKSGQPVSGGEGSNSRIGALPFLIGSLNEAESRRAQVFNADAVLAVEQEARELYKEMAEYLANQITRTAISQLNSAE